MTDNSRTTPSDRWQHLASSWQPIPKNSGYALGLAIILFAIVLMPLLYFAIISAISYATYWHLTTNIPDLTSRRGGRTSLALLFLYILPGIAGLLLVIVLLKPIFAPRSRQGRPIVLEKFEEPELFDFVERVCTAIGAPIPKSIHINCDVNASAGFRSGILSLFKSGDLVLTIGMPLVAGLSKRQFAGILAHEFGHFAQGAGMRTTYVAGTFINWCARVAFEHDRWDDWLRQLRNAGEGRIALMAMGLQLCLWITRVIIRMLAFVGMMLCSFMLRRMEYDADRYEVQFAGTKDFSHTFQKMSELNEAVPITMEECRRMYMKDKQVPNNYPALVADYSKRLPPETRDAIAESLEKERSGLFSTHPSTRSRVAAAEKLDQPGLYTDETSARQLFGDFTSACIKASYGHWRGMLDTELETVTLIDTMPLLKMTGQGASKQDAVANYIGFEPPTWRPFFPGMAKVASTENIKPIVERLKKARAKIKELSESVKPQAQVFRTQSEQRIKWELTRAILDAGLTVNFKSMGLKSTTRAGVSEAIDRHNTHAVQAAGSVDELAGVAEIRVRAALALLGVRGIESLIDDAPERRERADALLAALSAMREVLPCVQKVRELVGVIGVAGLSVKDQKTFDKAKAVVRPLSDQMRDQMDTARRIAGAVPDPLDHGEFGTNLGDTLVGATPGWREIDEIMGAGQTFVDRYADVYRRTIAELIYVAQRAEQGLIKAAKQQGAAQAEA